MEQVIKCGGVRLLPLGVRECDLHCFVAAGLRMDGARGSGRPCQRQAHAHISPHPTFTQHAQVGRFPKQVFLMSVLVFLGPGEQQVVCVCSSQFIASSFGFDKQLMFLRSLFECATVCGSGVLTMVPTTAP
jgi:hypothetical protein